MRGVWVGVVLCGVGASAVWAQADEGIGDVPIPVSIPQKQGAGHTSPFEGVRVVTRGVVTVVDANGYYLQDVPGDGDPRTSDAVRVFRGFAAGVAAGDLLQVEATVDEYLPGGAASGNLSVTELVDPVHVALGTAPVPEPVRIGAGGRRPPTRSIDHDAFAAFDPERDGIDFFESIEGMRVMLQDARAVSATNRFGEIFCVVDGGAGATGLGARGALGISPHDFNPERIQVQVDARILAQPTPSVDVGARLGDPTGVVSYGFGSYEVLLSEPLAEPVPGALAPEVTWLRSTGDAIRVASFNVLNLDPNDDDGDADVADGRFAAAARTLAVNLRAPEIVALQEVQDDDGSERSSVTSADRTLQLLVDEIVAAGGPRYAYIDHPFIGNGTSGGQPGGNIRVAYLYDPARVRLVPGSTATVTGPWAQQPDPEDPFFAARPPLVAQFARGGSVLTLVNVHFSSKGGSAPLFGQVQPVARLQEDPAVNGGVDIRRRQALRVSRFVGELLAADPASHVMVLGDFNEFEFVSPLVLLGEHLVNLTWMLPGAERYTFVFQGNAQSLDHILVTPRLARSARLDIVHVHSERAPTPDRASDHDPLLARIRLPSDSCGRGHRGDSIPAVR